MGEFDAFIGGREIEGEPYTYDPAVPFDWLRARMVGGRTNVWGRISLRFGPGDFLPGNRDGISENWPIGYADLAPYYDALDRLIGVTGSIERLPDDPDGIFLPPPAPRAAERLFREACTKIGLRCIPARLSVLSRAHRGRAACIGCGNCSRGCRVGACFSSPSVLLAPALATGRLRLITGAMARAIEVSSSGVASAVLYVDVATGEERRIRADAVVLAAGACETARLLLNSAT
ncbi:MAG TPA: GMC family oxidoreductase N-terminal domain-containing protein, partial [Gemmatimonadaceae bacterium]